MNISRKNSMLRVKKHVSKVKNSYLMAFSHCPLHDKILVKWKKTKMIIVTISKYLAYFTIKCKIAITLLQIKLTNFCNFSNMMMNLK
jgi:hypothetical protein